MTMYKALHPRDDVDRLYESRKKWGKELAFTKDRVDASIRLEDFIEKQEAGLIDAIRNNTNNTIANRMTIIKKQKWEGKQLYERFKQLINNISPEKNLDVAKKRKP